MKKIFLLLTALICGMSINAQVVKVYDKNTSTTEPVAKYANTANLTYKVLFEETNGDKSQGVNVFNKVYSEETPVATYNNSDETPYKVTFEPATSGSDYHSGYVDLGLPSGTLWATHNIGATNPEDYGKYFAWGETTGYTEIEIGKSLHTFNTVSTITADLSGNNDAATVNWSSNWQMPSEAQIEELVKYCTWTWTENYNETNVAGSIVTSNAAGNVNSIFIPAAGIYGSITSTSTRWTYTRIQEGVQGWYWGRSYNGNGVNMYFESDATANGTGNNSTKFGMPIRPVRVAKADRNTATSIELNSTSAQLANGGTVQLTATITPASADQKPYWHSSDQAVATVDQNGLVTCGTSDKSKSATITCTTDGGAGVSATCTITVVNPE